MQKTMKLLLLAGLALNWQSVAFSAERPLLGAEELTRLFDGIAKRQPMADTRVYPNVPMTVAQNEVRSGTVWVRWMGNGGSTPDGGMRFTPTHLQIEVEQQRPLSLSARVLCRLLRAEPIHFLEFTLRRDGSMPFLSGELTSLGPLVRPGWSTVIFPPVRRALPIFGYTDLGREMAQSVLRGLLVALRR